MAKRHWRENRDEATAAPETPPPPGRGEQIPCLVIHATPDGYVVGRAKVAKSEVDWLSPTHVREHLETRPKDVVISAEKWVNEDGEVVLKPKRVNKGAPVQTVVGRHVVFGELLDSMSHRAQKELKAQVTAALKGRKTYWRHVCPRTDYAGLPLWQPTPHGEACALCGKTEGGKKASAA